MTRAEEQLEYLCRAEDIIRNGRKANLPYKLPIPVKRDKNNKLTAYYSTRDWFAKIVEETFEAHEYATLHNCDEYESGEFEFELAMELADIITVCTSYLESLGYNEEARSGLFRLVNEKNRNCGYLED